MKEMLCIYSSFDTPRLRYALDVVFRHVLQTGYWITPHKETFSRFEGPRLNYSEGPVSGQEVWIPAGPLLRKTCIRPQGIKVENREGLPAFFFQPCPGADFDFDLLSLVFFMASRYEEYLPARRDAHGRFPAHESLAFREGFLEIPMVDSWALALAGKLEARFPGFRIERPAFRFLPTFDVDQAWAWRYKPAWLQWAGVLRDVLQGNRRALCRRREVLAGRLDDPFFTFADIEEWHRRPESDPIFFFHLGNYGRFDKSTPHKHPMLCTLISRLAGAHRTGLHPSWRAAGADASLAEEIRRYFHITGAPPIRSRQHFLRLELPRTYRSLLAAGIREDYTMGYADAPGFRAGISGPFPWYDLKAEAATELTIHPFAVMDVTLKEYLALDPEAGLERAAGLLNAVYKVGGVFCTLWHNSSFSGIGNWKPWRGMYMRLKAMAQGEEPILEN